MVTLSQQLWLVSGAEIEASSVDHKANAGPSHLLLTACRIKGLTGFQRLPTESPVCSPAS